MVHVHVHASGFSIKIVHVRANYTRAELMNSGVLVLSLTNPVSLTTRVVELSPVGLAKKEVIIQSLC